MLILAVGDVRLTATPQDSVFRNVGEELGLGDALFGNCEFTYESAFTQHSCDADCRVGTMKRAGFTVMSCANNRFADMGPKALREMLAALDQHGIATCGAGGDHARARRPAELIVSGERTAFFAYTAVRDSEGKADIPEIANLHPTTTYVDVEPNQPGSPPSVRTTVSATELKQLVVSVEEARASYDRVFVSFHWGVHLLPYVVADYERELAHAVIEAGADAVFGHHQHVLKPIEFYRNRPIFYGLGNFATYVSPAGRGPGSHSHQPVDGRRRYGAYRSKPYPRTWSRSPASLRITFIARCIFGPGSTEPRVELVPCHFDSMNRPVACEVNSSTGRRVLRYLRDADDVMELGTVFRCFPGSPYIVAASAASNS